MIGFAACYIELLMQAMQRLSKQSVSDMEQLLANTSSSAVLSLLFRIISNPTVFPADSSIRSTALRFRRQLLGISFNWPQLRKDCDAVQLNITQDQVPQSARSVLYSMAGDGAGSYFLETAIECSEIDFLLPLLATGIESNVRDYASDKCGNFVLQAILRRHAMEQKQRLQQRGSDATCAAIEQQAKVLIEELLSDSHFFTELVNAKGGVAYWMLAAAEHRPELSTRVGLELISAWLHSDEQSDSTEKVDGADDAQASKIKRLSLVFNSKFTRPTSAGASTEKKHANGKKKGAAVDAEARNDSTQLLVAKLVAQLLVSPSKDVSDTVANAFANMSPEALLYVATTGSVSRAVLDVFFDRFRQTIPLKILTSNMCVHGVEIAQHYVGQHVLRQAFEACDVRGKEKWAMLCTSNREALVRSKEGRNSLHLVNAELYQRDAAEWRSAVKRKAKAEMLLHELDDVTPHSRSQQSRIINSSAAAAATAVDSSTDEQSNKKRAVPQEEEEVAAAICTAADQSARKRKRKRQKKSSEKDD